MEGELRLYIGFFVVASAAFGLGWAIYAWVRNVGSELVGTVRGRIDHLGRFGTRTRVAVRRGTFGGTVPRVLLRLFGSKQIELGGDEARKLAERVEEAARLADGAG